MKKLVALVLALCLSLTAVSAFAVELLSAGDTYPLSTDKVITFYAQDCLQPHEKYLDVSESPFHIGLSENTGVKIEWSFPTTGADGNTVTNAMLVEPDSLPNIMKVAIMERSSLLLDDGVIWDLTPYIQEYAPAYYAFLQSNPAYDRAMKTDDGRYYAFGYFREDGGWNDSHAGLVVRKDWLDECGLEIPKTISEVENVIRVFNEKYGAQFTFNFGGRFGTASLQGAFGAYCSGTLSDWGWYVKDGKVGMGAADPEYRNYVAWLSKLWADGLIDQDVFTLDDTSVKAKIHNDKAGISYTSMGQLSNWNNERVAEGKEPVWIGIPYPTADDGSLSSLYGNAGIGTHTTVITKTADEETMKICLQLLDYAYTQEGFYYWNFGQEGVSWVKGENGEVVTTDLVKNDPDNDVTVKYGGATWGGPAIQATQLLVEKNSAAAIEANNTWFYNYEDEEKNYAVTAGWRWPSGISFTTDESDQLDMMNSSSLNTYVSESFTAFVTGTKDVNDDATWNAYLADLETNNLSKILEIRQAAYERYLAR